MRKHFLLLFLMALLPLAGWATDYNVTVFAKNKTLYFGEANPNTADAKATMFDVMGTTDNNIVEKIADAISFSTERTSASAVSAGGYPFTLAKDVNYVVDNADRYFITIAEATAKFIVRKADIENDAAVISITGSKAIQANGKAEPAIDFIVGEETLVKGVDYTVAYTNNTVAGQNATITVTSIAGSAKLVGEKTKSTTFGVGARGIEDIVVTLKSTFQPTFTGKQITITANDIQSVKQDGVDLADSEWAIDSYANNVEAGTTAKVIFRGSGAHDANSTKAVEFTIYPATSLNIVTFNDIANLTYTGKKAQPVVTAYIDLNNDNQFDPNNDYEITVADQFTLTTNNTNATDNATVTVAGLGKNFATTATKDLSYVIEQFSLANAIITIGNVEYSGLPQEVKPVLTIGTGDGAVTIPKDEYTLAYTDGHDKAKGADGYDVTRIQDNIKVVATANQNSTNYTGATPGVNEANVIKYNITAKAITVKAVPFVMGAGADKPLAIELKEGSALVTADTWDAFVGTVNLLDPAKYDFYADDNNVKGNILNSVPQNVGKYWYALKDGALTSAVAGNYLITSEAAQFEITTAQIIAKVKNQEDVVYGTAPAEWSLEYVSGLGTGDAAVTAFNTIMNGVQLNQNDFSFVDENITPANVAQLDVNDAGYAVKYTGVLTPGNYQISVQNGLLKHVAKELNDQSGNPLAYDVDIVINEGNNITYEGAATTADWTASYAGMNVKDQLVLAYDAVYNAGNHTALVTPKAGNKNFKATRVVQELVNNQNQNVTHYDRPVAYTIDQAELEIVADNKDWTFGSTANAPLSFTVNGLVGKDLTDYQAGTLDFTNATSTAAHSFTGTVKVDIVGSDGVGTHSNALVPSGITASVNYKKKTGDISESAVTFTNGNLVVAKGTVTVKIKDKEVIYGENPGAFELEVVGDNITDEQKASINQIVQWTHATNYSADNMKKVLPNESDYYEITATDADAATATNYTVNDIQPGKLTIKKRPITFTAKSFVNDGVSDNRVAYGDLPAWLQALEVSANFIDVTTGSIASVATYNLGETINDLISDIAPESTIINKDNKIKLTIAENEKSANYDITVLDGILQVTSTGVQQILFTSEDADLTTITNLAGAQANVKINFAPRTQKLSGTGAEHSWKASCWNTMVLPFDITVGELSSILGYAIVNVIDAGGAKMDGDDHIFKFKLTMKGGNGSETVLKAHKPFVIKTADDLKLKDGDNDYYYDFGLRTIEPITGTDPLSVDAGFDCKFTGTYTTVQANKNVAYRYLYGDRNDAQSWRYLTSENTWNIVPFAGYIDMSAIGSAEAVTFVMEELDGSTTAIKCVADTMDNTMTNAEGMYNLNGMKLNTVPTQKGVYIKNGKKVVVK